MENLPDYLAPLFMVTTVLTIILFAQATPSRNFTMVFLLIWSGIWYFVADRGFFLDTAATPPRVIFMMGPVVLFIIALFVTKKGKQFIDSLDLKRLTMLHIVRLPVEIVLMILAIHKTIPDLLTYEGRNFDIIMGLTALPMVWFIFSRGVSKKVLLWWNILGVVLLFNVVIHGVLSLPVPFQQFAMEQPNIAMLYAPYNLLPGVIVPLVMFSQLAAIRQLLRNNPLRS
jgi:hypothetical protein